MKMEYICNEHYTGRNFPFITEIRSESYQIFQQAYTEDVLKLSTAFRRYKTLKKHLFLSSVVIVSEDRSATLNGLVDILDISRGSAFTILHDSLHITLKLSCEAEVSI